MQCNRNPISCIERFRWLIYNVSRLPMSDPFQNLKSQVQSPHLSLDSSFQGHRFKNKHISSLSSQRIIFSLYLLIHFFKRKELCFKKKRKPAIFFIQFSWDIKNKKTYNLMEHFNSPRMREKTRGPRVERGRVKAPSQMK